jgi:hypothetical protein
MSDRLIFTIIMIIGLSAFSSSWAENELTLEAAMGAASGNIPFTSEWSGSVGEDGLIYREFASKIGYRYNSWLNLSSTIGVFSDWKKPRYILYFDRPDLWENLESKRKIWYLRPTANLSGEWFKFELGASLLIKEADSLENKAEYDIFNEGKSLYPVLGMEFGESNTFIYAGYSNSFPLISGGGVFEIGMGGRFRGIYEHKVFAAASGYQMISIGYRGEYRIYNDIAITPGISYGGKVNENVYTFSIGVKSLVEL